MNVEKLVVIGDLHHTARADTERAACWRPDGIPRLLARRHAVVLCGHVHTNGFIDWRGEDGGRIVQVHVSSLWDGVEPALRETISNPEEYGRFYEREGRADAAAFFASFRPGLATYRHFEGAGFALLKSSTDTVTVSLFAENSATPFARTVIDEL